MKNRVYDFLSFAVGIISLSLGVILIVKAELGVSVVSAFAYIYNKKFSNFTLGQWTYLVQVILFILTIFVVKKLKVKYLISFVVAYIFGRWVDIWDQILIPFDFKSIHIRIFFYFLGTLATAYGISFFIKSKYPLLPFDNFVQELANIKKMNFGQIKMYFDFIVLFLSLLSSLVFFSSIIAINIGTIISALAVGPLVKKILLSQEKTSIKNDNTNINAKILEYNLFDLKYLSK